MKVDLRLFFIEALASNPKIDKDIAKLYDKYKYRAHRAARSSELYNHPILSDGNIAKEVTCKRILGLMLLDEEEIAIELENIIKKGWLKVYEYVINKKEISLKQTVEKFYKINMSDDEINSILVTTLVLCINNNINIINDDHYDFVMQVFYDRIKHYSDDKEYLIENGIDRFSYDNLSKDIKQKAKSIKNRIFEEYGMITNTNNLLYSIRDPYIEEYVNRISMIFDTEDLMFPSLTNHIKIQSKDIEELAALYYLSYKNQNREEAMKFIAVGIFIKFTLKAYKEVKDYYFNNNKETLYIELEGLENDKESLEKEKSRLEQENNSLQLEINKLRNEYKIGIEKENIELKKEIEKLKSQIEEHKENEKELYALREAIFEVGQRDESSNYIENEKPVELTEVNVLIVGGHENWRRKLQEDLPKTFKFLDGTKENFDIQILYDTEYVFFYTAYMNHATYERIINYSKKNNIEIGYINSTSIESVKKEIVSKLYKNS